LEATDSFRKKRIETERPNKIPEKAYNLLNSKDFKWQQKFKDDHDSRVSGKKGYVLLSCDIPVKGVTTLYDVSIPTCIPRVDRASQHKPQQEKHSRGDKY
jgi:hypothetical protein